MSFQERITSIDQLAAVYANSMKGFNLVTYYKGAFPVYRVNSEIVIQRKKELGLIEEYCLKFIRAGAKNINNVKDFLGLDEKVVQANLLKLHQLDMINYRFSTKEVVITSKGIDVLEKNSFIIPETIDYTFLVDGVTGEYQMNESLEKRDRIKNSSHAIPFIESIPTVENINLKFIKDVAIAQNRVNLGNYLDGEILAIKKIDKVEKLYRRLNILVFVNNLGDYELQIYDFNKRIPKYEVKLIQMIKKNYNIIPTVEFDSRLDNVKDSKLDEENIKIKKDEILNLEESIKDLESRVEEVEAIEVESDEEYLSKTMKIEMLEKQLQKEREKYKSATKILNTYDHRPILINALKNAFKQVVIVSPWIKTAATDAELRGLIQNAMQRDVKVVICYGISNEVESDVKYAIELLNKLKNDSRYGNNLTLVKLGNTHEKVLICDEKFHVITSFNWLSFKGDPKRGFRQETGTYIEDEEKTKEMIINLQKRIIETNNNVNILL